ncbi:LOW QUALITY PROTEIN: uncharacterized protein YdhS-like [Montipora foliosa]|uniref:LOW QUALITY PROTEIN: uncharacterized protein YdhS-like n=1 Tax=Montipora foliosa TaxID=591990 RepID=UPI0035F16744
MNGTGPVYDIAYIVGAGAYGTSVLGQMSSNMIPKGHGPFRILVVESSQDVGPGMPYSKYMTIPEHIVNIAGGCTQVTATYIPLPERSDFLLWLRSLPSEYRVSLGIEASENPTWLNKPFPRFVVGLYLSNRFSQFVMALRDKGFTVDVRRLTKVTSVLPKNVLGRFGYELELDRKSKVFAGNLFLARGHWTYNRFPNFSHWLPSPFPPRDIQNRTELGGNSGILGCSLSGIDAVLTLSKKNGSFQSMHQNGKDYWKFVPFQGAEEFKMTMYGRKAILPQVMGVVVNKIFKHKYLTPAFFIPIIEANGGFLPLDDFWYLLKKEVYDEVPRLRPHLPDCWETMPLEEAATIVRKLLQTTDPVERLSRELEEAKESLKTGVPVLLQNVFYQSYAVFDEAFNYFSAEDRIRFEEIKTELHLLIGPFPVQNAEKILALMKDGYLEVKKIGTNYEIQEAEDKSGIKLSWKQDGDTTCEAHHDVMIDATGQNAAFGKDFSPLTISLRNAKLIKEILVPFRNAMESHHHRDHPNVVTRNGVNYFRPSGALIDINNFSLVPGTDDPSPPIYYMGPFTMGQVAFPQDMSVVTTAAERAVADLIKRGVLERDVKVEHDPTPIYGWLVNTKGWDLVLWDKWHSHRA